MRDSEHLVEFTADNSKYYPASRPVIYTLNPSQIFCYRIFEEEIGRTIKIKKDRMLPGGPRLVWYPVIRSEPYCLLLAGAVQLTEVICAKLRSLSS
jgi:hypothetical protein